MSSEKNPEVVGCDASIMKNVWEIRVREFNQKMLLEQERLEKSALPSINKDWANRMIAKTGGYKRAERKVQPADTQTDSNVWKSKQPLVPQTVPQGKGPRGRPGIQAKGLSPPASTVKDKQSFNRLQLLIFITETQPSSLVWGGAWRYNKSPAEGSTLSSDWGQSWMFAPHQPDSEGQTWLKESNQEDRLNLHLWRKPDHRTEESQELDLSLSTEEWQMSWKRFDEMKKNERVNEENVLKLGFFTSLVESQHHSETLCSSEWIDSWQTTKQQGPCTDPDEDFMNVSDANQQQNEGDISSECWRLVNHHGSSQIQKPPSPDWVTSWRAAMKVFNNKQSTDPSSNQDHIQQGESHFYKVLHASREHNRDLDPRLCSSPEADWNKSWQTMKNDSKPCEEIEKVLKALPPQMDVCSEPQRVEKNSTEREDPRWEQLKHDVIYRTKRDLKLRSRQVQKLLPLSEWRDSWKIMKHRMRLERRRYGASPQKPFRESGEGVKSQTSDWKDSWRFICQPLNQKPDLWQQGWSTSTQIHVNWERHQKNISLEEFPKNGPTMERIWSESWKFSRHHHRSEPGQNVEQISKDKSSAPSKHPDDSYESPTRSTSDWEDAWMFSESSCHQDKPSSSQWRESWRWFTHHTLNWTEQVPVDKRVTESVEIQNIKKIHFLQRDDRSSETDWSSSWRAGDLLNSQFYYCSSEQIKSSAAHQQQDFTSEYGSKWGMSFRLANPMPHLEQPWLESCSNPSSYWVLWSRGSKIRNDIKSNLNNNSAFIMFWENSHQFLQKAGAQFKNKQQSKESSDPRVILTKKIQTRKHLCSSVEKVNQSERKWAGGHLLGKTQLRPKRGHGSGNNKLKLKENTEEFSEDWMESWRFLLQPESLKKQIRLKFLSGWDESWKFLLPPY